ncbi:MAG: hypothetical protein ACYC1Q_09700, partial [Bacteroidia bacterium]
MDKKNLPSLDELLNKVRQSEPVMQADEAINWLNAQKELPLQKHRFKPSKIIIMTSIISSMGIAVLVWIFGQGRGDSLQLADRTIDHRPWTIDSPRTIYDGRSQSLNEGPAMVPETQSAMVHGLWSMDQVIPSTVDREPLSATIDTPRTDTLRVIRIQNEVREDEQEGEAPGLVQEFVFDIQIDPANRLPCREEINALVLDPQDLKKLGIVSDQGTLLYQQDDTREGQIKLVFQGSLLSNYSRSVSGLSHLTAPDILPLAISNCNGKFQFPESDIPDSTKLEAALAVRVPVNEQGDYLLFWFPRNKD